MSSRPSTRAACLSTLLGLLLIAGCGGGEGEPAPIGGDQTGLADTPPVVGGATPTGTPPADAQAPGGR